MKTHFFLHWIAAALAAAPLASHAQGQFLARHSGANDPRTEGFGTGGFGVPVVQAVTNDMGLDAWSVGVAHSAINYRISLADFSTSDWKLSVGLRVIEPGTPVPAFYTHIDTGEVTFFLNVGSDSSGDPLVQVTGSGIGPVLLLPDAGSTYHQFELMFSTEAETATLWIDGARYLDEITGGQGITPSIQFGGQAEVSSKLLQANWNLVSLEIIPEPSALALLAIGGVMLAARLYRRRLQS